VAIRIKSWILGVSQMMKVNHKLSIFLVCYWFSLTAAMAQAAIDNISNQTVKPTPTNSAGRTVIDPNGGRLNYLLANAGVDLASRGIDGVTNIIVNKPIESRRSPVLTSKANQIIAVSAATGDIVETWRTGVMGNGLGLAGIVVADIDGDGSMEVLSAGDISTFGANQFWYELEYQASTQDYQMNWISAPEDAGIRVLTAIDVDPGSAGGSVFLGLGSGDVRVISGVTREQIGFIETAGGAVRRILFADADNDGNNEIVACSDVQVSLVDPVTLTIETTLPFGASDCEVGNVDEDAAIEIILSDGRVLEFDGIDTVLEWTYPGGEFGALVELADIDNDPVLEIIGASAWYYITAFDAALQSPLWQIQTSHDVDALLMADVTGDGRVELLYGDGQWGNVYAFDTQTVTEIWRIDNPLHGVGNIVVGDSDDDDRLEVLYSSGHSDTGRDQLAIHDITGTVIEWQSIHLDGPFNAVTIGDGNGNGHLEDIAISFSSNSGYDDGIMQIFNSLNNTLLWASQPGTFGGYAWTGVHDVAIGDVDNDGHIEIVVATDRLYDGAIYIFDGASRQIEAQYFYDSPPVFSLAIEDVDNDGANEIIAGPGSYVYVINGATGTVEWKSIHLGSTIGQISVADVDDDSVPEIVALNTSLFVIDGISHIQWQSSNSGFTGMDVFDVTGDGRPEILAGTETGQLIALDGITHDEVFSHNSGETAPIPGLNAFWRPNDPAAKLAFTQLGQLKVFDLDSGTTVFQSEVLGNVAGAGNGLALQLRKDGVFEILVGTDYSLHQFTVPDGELIFRDGFE